MVLNLSVFSSDFDYTGDWWGIPCEDFLFRLDFRLEVSGIVGGDFSFSPVVPEDGLIQ